MDPLFGKQTVSKAAIGQYRVIDLGCGTGMIGIPLAESGLSVTALDVNLNALKILAFRAKERRVSLTIVCGNVENLCFSENAFDLAIASEVFEHLVNPLAFAKSIERIVRPGGSLIVTIPNGFSLLELYRRLRRIGRLVLNRIRRFEFKAGPDAHMQWFAFGQFVRLVENSTSFRLQAKRHSNVISGFLYYVFGIRSYALE
jgi:2-polyprenyl-3-methyl-5-hydroxy-6-metoxy-1,4-benzoquinol methylase